MSELYIKSSATCAKKAEYYYSCACGEKGTETFEYGDKLPHTFDKQVVSKLYIKSSATCMTKAEYYYSCECGEKGTKTFVDENGEFSTEAHPYEDVWYNDEQFHYHKSSCSHAVVKDKTAHSFGENDTCTVCGCRKTSTGLSFTYYSNYNGYILTGIGTCKDLDIIVPSAYNEKPVVGIGGNAFSNSSITSIIIPDSLTSIGAGAFERCSSLKNATISDNVTFIGNSAFLGCSKLENISIPESITSIGKEVFRWCISLTNIIIPDGVKSIGDYAFSGCSLTSVTIPDVVTSIGEYAFCNNGLTSVEIGNRVTSIGKYAFKNCSGLTSIIIPNSVTFIGEGAFNGCSNLQEITVPFIGESKTANKGYNQVFGHIFGQGQGTGAIWQYHNSETGYFYYYYIPVSLRKVIISGSITSIPSYAFNNCSQLTSVAVPNSITLIGAQAFRNCRRLKNISIPKGVTSIAVTAFSNCNGLTSVNVSSDNKKYHSIANCIIETATKTLVVACNNSIIPTDGSVISVGNYAFSGRSELTSITIPNSVTNIGASAFNGSGLTTITIPTSVTSIGNSAFGNCSSLMSVVWNAENCTEAGSSRSRIFGSCSKLTTITIGDNVKIIPAYAFSGCSRLTSMIIPDRVTSIGAWAFDDCSRLTRINIGSNVTNIGSSVFYGCGSLKEVFYKGTDSQWGIISISSTNNSCLTNATRYYYSESQPVESGKYWHYVDGEIVVW